MSVKMQVARNDGVTQRKGRVTVSRYRHRRETVWTCQQGRIQKRRAAAWSV
jgi:hypothetical protein